MKLKNALLISAGLAWANALIAVLAQGFWAKAFGRLCGKLDLTYAQGLLVIPAISITLCGLTGFFVFLFLVRGIKNKNLFSVISEKWAWGFCLSAFLFYIAVNVRGASTFAQMLSNLKVEQKYRMVYEAGVVQDGQYQNDFYGFGFRVPTGWHKASWPTVQRKKISGYASTFSLWNDNRSVTNLVVKHTDGVDTLVAILKYAPDSQNYNPSLVVNVNDKQLITKQYGVTNLLGFAEMLANVPLPYRVEQSPVPAIVGGRTAFILKIILIQNSITIGQKITVFETGNSYLEFVASTIEDDDAANLSACLNTLKFVK